MEPFMLFLKENGLKANWKDSGRPVQTIRGMDLMMMEEVDDETVDILVNHYLEIKIDDFQKFLEVFGIEQEYNILPKQWYENIKLYSTYITKESIDKDVYYFYFDIKGSREKMKEEIRKNQKEICLKMGFEWERLALKEVFEKGYTEKVLFEQTFEFYYAMRRSTQDKNRNEELFKKLRDALTQERKLNEEVKNCGIFF